MKLKNILISGLGVVALTACNDFLEVPVPSGYTTDIVFGSTTEANTALNGVYVKALVNNAFGNNLYNSLMLNSDVDFSANTNEQAQENLPRRFDMKADGNTTTNLWNAMYAGIEEANEFICNLEASQPAVKKYLDGEDVTDLPNDYLDYAQLLGEARVLRAMFYHELLSYYGDIPFTLHSTYETDNLLPPVTKREEVSKQIIEDLKKNAPYMKSNTAMSEGVERISKEACCAMIARLALQAGGYSLNHDEGDATSYGKMTRPADYKKYYEIARDYCALVMESGSHSLTKNFRDVFVDECSYVVNSHDDAIFELPFARETNGNWGYSQGPTASSSGGETAGHEWGKCDGGVRTTAFYRYQFEEGDARRDYVCGMWYYTNEGLPTMRFDYAMHNNKWSKLWNPIPNGKATEGSTGINFAYLRYADVLLMFAEAENELNGPTQDVQDAVNQVRERAFRGSGVDYKAKVTAATTKEAMLDVILDERKHEFAGENMRWKDLVRNNKYNEVLFYTFLLYQGMAENSQGSAQYLDMVEQHDGILYSEIIPSSVYSCPVRNLGNNPNFPNNQLYVRYIANPYTPAQMPQVSPNNSDIQVGVDEKGEPILLKNIAVTDKSITGLSSSSSTYLWTETNTMDWWDTNGYPKPQVLYSLYGYIRGNQNNEVILNNNGKEEKINPNTYNVNNLPVVRYLLPYPQEAIARSSGVYKNYYGY